MRKTADQRACEAVRNWDKYAIDAKFRMVASHSVKGKKGFQKIDSSELGTTRDKISEESGIGKNKIQEARTLFLKDPERFERVTAGLEPLTSSFQCVYVIGHKGRSDLPIKIGKSNNPLKRFWSLQTSHYTELDILFVIPGYSKLEKEIHGRFWQYHVRGEWFDLTPLQIAQIKLEYQGIDPEEL